MGWTVLLDDHGRLFGRVNLVDAAFLLLLCVLIPLMYGAYLLFRTPLPTVLRTVPTVITTETRQMDLEGHALRPYLRILIGAREVDFAVRDAEHGIVRWTTPLAVGRHVIHIYDSVTEIGRFDGVMVLPAPVWSGSRFLVESSDVLTMGEAPESIRLVVIKDQATNTCALWRAIPSGQSVWRVEAIPCRP